MCSKECTLYLQVDFAAEDESVLLPWLLGLQQLIVYFAPTLTSPAERWTLSKLHLQKLRLKVSGESDKSGQGPYDVVLSAVLDVAQELQATPPTNPPCLPHRVPPPTHPVYPVRRLHRLPWPGMWHSVCTTPSEPAS